MAGKVKGFRASPHLFLRGPEANVLDVKYSRYYATDIVIPAAQRIR